MGVVSDKCNNIGQCVWNGLKEFCGISAREYVWGGTGDEFCEETKGNHWADNEDIITMELDCHSSQITFKIKDKIFYGPMQLPKRDAWYPAVACEYAAFEGSVTFIQVTE